MNYIQNLYNILIYKSFIPILIVITQLYQVCNAQQLNDSITVDSLYYSSKNHYSNSKYSLAIENLREAIKIKQKEAIDYPPEYFKIYNKLGLNYIGTGSSQEAISNYMKALEFTNNEYYRSIIVNNIATIYVQKGDFIKAIDYYENTLSQLNKSSHPDKNIILVDNYHNQGYTYLNQGNYPLAIKRFLKAIDIAKNDNIFDISESYFNCGLAFVKMDSLQKAKYYYEKALEINSEVFGKNHIKTILSNLYLADLYSRNKEYEKAELLYKDILPRLSSIGKKHPYTSYYHWYKGNMYFGQGNIENALKSYQQALISKVFGFNDVSIHKNPSLSTIPDIDLIEILKSKSLALEILSRNTDKEYNLNASLTTLILTIEYIEKMRKGYLNEPSKLELAEKEHESYMSIITISYKLAKITGDKKYDDLAFRYSDRSKYAVLKELINVESGNDSIIQEERKIKAQIGNIWVKLANENKQVNPDSLKINTLKEALFDLNRMQEEVALHLEKRQLKSKNKFIGIKELQENLSESEVLISYDLTDSTLFTFAITKRNYNLTKSFIDSTFYNNLNSFTRFLHREEMSRYPSFRNPSYELYKVLLEPNKDLLQGKNLIIVPSGELSLIAFEALTTESYFEKEYADYRLEPFLIREYPIGYAFSASLLVSSKKKEKKWNPRFLGFAPDYYNYSDSLVHLPMVRKGLKKIARWFKGDIYTGGKATENNFKKKVKDYGILHLYAYGIDNKKDAALSRIFLTKKGDTIDDGYLYAYEVGNLETNADLIVLASCYSGRGRINKGEGVLSIGRNFLNSGNTSIIISLWQAYVEPSMKILNEFYKQLALGKRKDKAMQIAKLKFLESSSFLDGNPKYWSSLVVIGNQEAMFKSNYLLKRILVPALILVIAFVSLLVIISKNRSS